MYIIYMLWRGVTMLTRLWAVLAVVTFGLAALALPPPVADGALDPKASLERTRARDLSGIYLIVPDEEGLLDDSYGTMISELNIDGFKEVLNTLPRDTPFGLVAVGLPTWGRANPAFLKCLKDSVESARMACSF